jgi:holdfast attachment protein HfaA
MPHSRKFTVLILSGVLAGIAGMTSAEAQSWNTASSYNGYDASSQNAASNYQLRDANGNLTVVNGQFQSSQYASQTGTQTAGTTSGGAGMSGTGAQYGQATAIGNSLNVVVLGNHNTTVVDATQINKGNQTANVDLNGH